METLSLFGERLNTGRMAKKALNARSFGTRAQSDRLSLSDRLTQSLITAGLVRGTTPLSIRRQCGVPIRDFALLPLDGSDQEKLCAG